MSGYRGLTINSWFGSGGKTTYYRNILAPAPEPPVFNPSSIANLELWLDANDTDTVIVNQDTSGVNLNRVMKWFDKAKPSNQNYFTHVGNPAFSGLYNTHYMNRLNTVYFEPNAYMDHEDGGLTFNFQARTVFIVSKPLTDLTLGNPYMGFLNSFEAGGMNTGVSYDSISGNHVYTLCENTYTCGIVFDLSNNSFKQRQIIMFAQTDQIDLSGNTAAFDTVYKSLIGSDPADSYSTSKQQYILNSPSYNTAQDIAEILLYGRLLTTTEQQQVNDYLADKWNLSGRNL